MLMFAIGVTFVSCKDKDKDSVSGGCTCKYSDGEVEVYTTEDFEIFKEEDGITITSCAQLQKLENEQAEMYGYPTAVCK